MKLSKKKFLDFLPFIAISIAAIVSLVSMIQLNYVVQWQHYLAWVFLIVNGYLYYRHHQLGVLFTGLIILLGLTCILSFSVGIAVYSAYWTPLAIPIFKGNPIFIVWLLLHFVVSGKYYTGVITKKYWQDLRIDASNKSPRL